MRKEKVAKAQNYCNYLFLSGLKKKANQPAGYCRDGIAGHG